VSVRKDTAARRKSANSKRAANRAARGSARADNAAAREVYRAAVTGAERLWNSAKAGDHPDHQDARQVVDRLAELLARNRPPLLALTALDQEGDYTFTHMVNVSALTMALASRLGIQGPLLRVFGCAALTHDIGKVRTPPEILHKPGRLTPEEFEIVKRHVVDGARILRQTPGAPPLSAVVAFEHHLKQDLSGYPEGIGHRELSLCTMVVSIADVFDALRSNRPYRRGVATPRIRAILDQQGNPQFNQALLREFINLMGLFPVGSLVRLATEELAVVTAEHPRDPFRPQVRIIRDARGNQLDQPQMVNTRTRGPASRIVEAVDPASLEVDPLHYL